MEIHNISPINTMRSVPSKLASGYFGRTLDRLLAAQRAVTVDEVVKTLSAPRRRDSHPAAVTSLVSNTPAKYFSPLRGVICSSRAPASWPQVLRAARKDFEANVLGALSAVKGKTADMLAEELTAQLRYTIVPAAVSDALYWLKSHDLAFRAEGSHEWARSVGLDTPIAPGRKVESALGRADQRAALAYMLS